MPLVIGFGNPLRSDDGAGPAVVARLITQRRMAGKCQWIVAHQLLLEHADALRRAEEVVFVDADASLAAGQVRLAPVTAQTTPTSLPLGHHLSPFGLLALTDSVFSHQPRAWAIGIGPASMDVGDELSPPVEDAVNRVVDLLVNRLTRVPKEH